MKELFRKLFCMLCKALSEPEEKSQFTEFHIARVGLKQEIEQAFSWMRDIKLDDNDYYYVSHEDWGPVIRDVLLNMPAYLTDKYDCDNSSNYCRCRTSSIYKLNTMGEAVGPSPWGYHAFNLFVSDIDGEPKLFILEPQNGDIYTVEEDSGYSIDRLVIG